MPDASASEKKSAAKVECFSLAVAGLKVLNTPRTSTQGRQVLVAWADARGSALQ
jgi:hypothetical protein